MGETPIMEIEMKEAAWYFPLAPNRKHNPKF